MSIKRRLAELEARQKQAADAAGTYTAKAWMADWREHPDATPAERHGRLCPGAAVTPKVRERWAGAARRRAQVAETLAMFDDEFEGNSGA